MNGEDARKRWGVKSFLKYLMKDFENPYDRKEHKVQTYLGNFERSVHPFLSHETASYVYIPSDFMCST